jgi:hypothetical protein
MLYLHEETNESKIYRCVCKREPKVIKWKEEKKKDKKDITPFKRKNRKKTNFF